MLKGLTAMSIRVLRGRTSWVLRTPSLLSPKVSRYGLNNPGRCTSCPVSLQTRCYSQDGDQRATLPATTTGMGHIWPSPFKSIKNFFIAQFLMPRIDPDFNLPDFMEGAKKAIEVISHLISKGDYLAMEDFVEPVVVTSVKDSLKDISLRDQQDLAVDKNDIMVSFPYSIDTFYRQDDDDIQTRVDVLVVCHVMKNWGESKQNAQVVLELDDSEVKRKVQFLNYQFSRTYIPTKESSWLVTGVHHFKPDVGN